MSGYDGTPAAVLRQALGAGPADDASEQFAAELPDREQAKRAFEQAWGFADPGGRPTERGWQRIEMREQQRRHATGEEWIGPVTDAEMARIFRNMRAAQAAAGVVTTATRGQLSPAEVEEWRTQATGPARGVAAPSD